MDLEALAAQNGVSLLHLHPDAYYSDVCRNGLYCAVGRAPTKHAKLYRSTKVMRPRRPYDANLIAYYNADLIAYKGSLSDPKIAEAVVHELAHTVVGDSETDCYEWAICDALEVLTGEAKEALRAGLVRILTELYVDIEGFDSSVEIPRFLERHGVDVDALMPPVDDDDLYIE